MDLGEHWKGLMGVAIGRGRADCAAAAVRAGRSAAPAGAAAEHARLDAELVYRYLYTTIVRLDTESMYRVLYTTIYEMQASSTAPQLAPGQALVERPFDQIYRKPFMPSQVNLMQL